MAISWLLSWTLNDISKVVTAGVTVFGGWLAWRGLNTWKDQVKASHDSELAKRLLVSLLRYREAIKLVRFPAMTATEWDANYAASKAVNESRFQAASLRYGARLNKLAGERANLNAVYLEAKLFWPEFACNEYKELQSLDKELVNAINTFLSAIDPFYSTETRQEFQVELTDKFRFLYEKENDPDIFRDKFQAKFDSFAEKCVKKIRGGQ